MKITLRRAAKLRNKVDGRITELRRELRNTHIYLNVHDPRPTKVISDARDRYLAVLARANALTDVLGHLRMEIGRVNSREGINALLTEMATIDQKLALAEDVAGATPSLSESQILARVEAERKMSENGNVHRGPDMTVYVLNAEVIRSAKETVANLTRRKESIQDAIEKVNAENDVQLSDEVFDVLKAEHLI